MVYNKPSSVVLCISIYSDMTLHYQECHLLISTEDGLGLQNRFLFYGGS